ncbi:ferredoxin [Tannockella kyphosi]|uniref:ferredoxin n=1 Tax=Tannockella kyphosi TaxID=2899121 RepID=UPI0020111B73|nr:ferredoxin [Tannockella kyphosi]
MAKALVNETCIGCGACVGVAPSVFDLGDEGLAVCIVDGDLGDNEDAAKEAAECCPVEAITVE